MKQVAKLVMIDSRGKYLLMYRSNHPTFGDDPDIPGGMIEKGELPLEGTVREVFEEVGLTIHPADMREIYAGTEYSAHNTHNSLYVSTFQDTPKITMSWEHSAYEWLEREAFLEKAKSANDSYMHMVYNVLKEGINK